MVLQFNLEILDGGTFRSQGGLVADVEGVVHEKSLQQRAGVNRGDQLLGGEVNHVDQLKRPQLWRRRSYHRTGEAVFGDAAA